MALLETAMLLGLGTLFAALTIGAGFFINGDLTIDKTPTPKGFWVVFVYAATILWLLATVTWAIFMGVFA